MNMRTGTTAALRVDRSPLLPTAMRPLRSVRGFRGLFLGDSTITRIPEQFAGAPSWRMSGDEEEVAEEDKDMLSEDITVYPNPFSNRFTVNYTLTESARKILFEIFDIAGRSIIKEEVLETSGGTRVLDVGECNGLYFLKITVDGRVIRTEKLICMEK